MRAGATASLLFVTTGLCSACVCDKAIESVTDDMVKMVRAGGEITAQLKVPAQVSASVEQGGKVVTVKLQRPPPEAMEEVRPKIEAIVRRHISGVREVRVSVDL